MHKDRFLNIVALAVLISNIIVIALLGPVDEEGPEKYRYASHVSIALTALLCICLSICGTLEARGSSPVHSLRSRRLCKKCKKACDAIQEDTIVELVFKDNYDIAMVRVYGVFQDNAEAVYKAITGVGNERIFHDNYFILPMVKTWEVTRDYYPDIFDRIQTMKEKRDGG